MEEIRYSRVTMGDLPTVVKLRLLFATEMSGLKAPELTDEFEIKNRKYLKKAISDNSFIAFLAKFEDEISGIGAMVFREQPPTFNNMSGKVGYLMNMYTFPDFRKQGICSKILSLLIDEAHRMGISSFELHATEVGESVYINNGFKKHGEPTYRKRII